MTAKAITFDDSQQVEVEILSKPSSTGLCKVKLSDGRTIARHRDRLTATNDEARSLLGVPSSKS